MEGGWDISNRKVVSILRLVLLINLLVQCFSLKTFGKSR